MVAGEHVYRGKKHRARAKGRGLEIIELERMEIATSLYLTSVPINRTMY